MQWKRLGWIVTGVLLVALTGCGKKYQVSLSYDLPAQTELSGQIQQLAVAEFSAPDRTDQRWGQRVADKVVSTISDFNRSKRRFRIVDRRTLETIRRERDIQLAMGDPQAAAEMGKIAQADAVIYGTVNVGSEKTTERQARLSPTEGRTYETIEVLKASVVVNFQMIRVSDGQTILAREEKATYDSRDAAEEGEDGGGTFATMRSAMGLGNSQKNGAPDSEKVIEDLLSQCVMDFVSLFSPHTVRTQVTLEKGKEKDLVERANKLASRENYAEALEIYEQARSAAPQDHETLFNIAVMHEALGRYTEAVEEYNRAFEMESRTKYLDGRERAQRALEASRGGS